jgi:hypothetical protein
MRSPISGHDRSHEEFPPNCTEQLHPAKTRSLMPRQISIRDNPPHDPESEWGVPESLHRQNHDH